MLRADERHSPTAFVALCSAVFGKPLQEQMVVLRSMRRVETSSASRIWPSPCRLPSTPVPGPVAADGEREGQPNDSRRVVRQVPEGTLRRTD